MEEIAFKPIGVIRSPFSDVEGMPVQSIAALGVKGTIELDPELTPGLKDLEGFSHIILIYYFHLNKGYSLEVIPFLDPAVKGVFATRVPRRPNGIGLSVVRLMGIKGNNLEIEDVDVLDQTPLLDIKPFVPKFDHRDVQSTGWFAKGALKASVIRADRRFIDQTGNDPN
jgi:tRNA (adenine37-N6)-methyltransferase